MTIFFHKCFAKQYRRLNRKLQKQVDIKIALFYQNPYDPHLNNHSLHGVYKEYRSIDITGDYRAWYKQLSEEVVEFRLVDTHSNLYS